MNITSTPGVYPMFNLWLFCIIDYVHNKKENASIMKPLKLRQDILIYSFEGHAPSNLLPDEQ